MDEMRTMNQKGDRIMNPVDVDTWNGNWAWSLPLIVLNVVIHVFGLVFINERVFPF